MFSIHVCYEFEQDLVVLTVGI